MKTIKNIVLNLIIPPIGFLLIYFVGITCRVKVVDGEKEKDIINNGINPILAFWHGRLFYFPYHYKWQRRHHILVSPSPDGKIIGEILKLFSFTVIWGSSHKQGSKALLNLVKSAKKNKSTVLIADGSRGPVYKAQIGAVGVSMLAGVPILPMTYSANRKITFNSWDKLILPYPFSKIVVVYGDPIYIDKTKDRNILESKRMELENELSKITEKADNIWSV